MIRRVVLALALCLLAFGSSADPSGSRTSIQNGSGTVVATNVFQAIFAGTANRYSCTVQNNGTHTMYVYLGPLANATLSASVQLAPGAAMYCGNGPVIFSDPISITGTNGDQFYANQW